MERFMSGPGVDSGKPRIFVDMDGTLCEFKLVDTMEKLYEEGYFLHLKPNRNVVEAVKMLIMDGSFDVYILSAYLSDSRYALYEKRDWLDTYLPELSPERHIFCKCGEDKADVINDMFGMNRQLCERDFLIDDYSMNLHSWEPPARGIKLLNGINGNFGTWTGEKVSMKRSPDELFHAVKDIVSGRKHYQDNFDLSAELEGFSAVTDVPENENRLSRHKR